LYNVSSHEAIGDPTCVDGCSSLFNLLVVPYV
jgi:hypothetical protein